MSKWQPIETAPKDGTYIIGFDEATARAWGTWHSGVCVLCWIDTDDEDEIEHGWEVQPFCEGLDVILSETNPTHWMPLPDPPE